MTFILFKSYFGTDIQLAYREWSFADEPHYECLGLGLQFLWSAF